MATTNQIYAGLARRLKNAGLRVSRSDRSETIYVKIGKRDLRISSHELGYADYGSREQKHLGPEVICDGLRFGEICSECLDATRTYIRAHAAYWIATDRANAAHSMRVFRRLAAKA